MRPISGFFYGYRVQEWLKTALYAANLICMHRSNSSLRCCAAFIPALFFIPFIAAAQEQLGMRLERYAGIYGATINPANTAFSPNRWEVSLFSADVFFENNYAFVRNSSLPHFLRNTDNLVSIGDTSGERALPANAVLVDFFDKKRPMHGVFQTRVTGPSFSFRINENNVIGLVTAFRSGVSAYKVPENLRYSNLEQLRRFQTLNVASSGVNGLAWGEIGLHYSHRNTDNDIHTAWGITPKLLLGMEGFYARAEANFDYQQQGGDTVAFGHAKWEYALTTANLNDNADARQFKIRGSGVGLDAGFTWVMPGEEEDEYQWRLGISLLDLGFVRMRNSAERHQLQVDTVVSVSQSQFQSNPDYQQAVRDLSQAFLGDPTASLQGRTFAVGLPTALSAQFDFRALPNVYLSGVWVQRVPLSKKSLYRPNTLAVVPRFERRWFSASLPIVLNDWQSLRVGLAARLGVLYLGTDNLNSFFRREQFTGSDFYIGLKINDFSFGERKGRGHKGGGGGRRGLKGVKCYEF